MKRQIRAALLRDDIGGLFIFVDKMSICSVLKDMITYLLSNNKNVLKVVLISCLQ